MNYLDDEEIRVGDRVTIDGGDVGTVVICLDSKTAVEDYDVSEWAYLGTGVMVLTDSGALVRVRNTVNSRGSVMISKLMD